MKIFLLGTAREGSTRVKDKMTRPLADVTLFDIYLSRFEFFQECTNVFSDMGMAIYPGDKKLWDATKKSEIPLIERSKESVTGVTDRAKELHFLKDIDADYIFWLNACLPLLSNITILDAVKKFKENDFKSMTSVRKRYTWFWDPITKKAINNKDPKVVSTQNSPPLYETAHAFHIFGRKYMLENSAYWGLTANDPYLFEIKNDVECLDIDSELDFEVVEYVWKKLNQSWSQK